MEPETDRASLIDMKEGQRGIIVSILGGRMATKRLADLGVTPGTKVKVLRNAPFHGPIEIEARDSRLVLGRGLASKVLVKS